MKLLHWSSSYPSLFKTHQGISTLSIIKSKILAMAYDDLTSAEHSRLTSNYLLTPLGHWAFSSTTHVVPSLVPKVLLRHSNGSRLHFIQMFMKYRTILTSNILNTVLFVLRTIVTTWHHITSHIYFCFFFPSRTDTPEGINFILFTDALQWLGSIQ